MSETNSVTLQVNGAEQLRKSVQRKYATNGGNNCFDPDTKRVPPPAPVETDPDSRVPPPAPVQPDSTTVLSPQRAQFAIDERMLREKARENPPRPRQGSKNL